MRFDVDFRRLMSLDESHWSSMYLHIPNRVDLEPFVPFSLLYCGVVNEKAVWFVVLEWISSGIWSSASTSASCSAVKEPGVPRDRTTRLISESFRNASELVACFDLPQFITLVRVSVGAVCEDKHGDCTTIWIQDCSDLFLIESFLGNYFRGSFHRMWCGISSVASVSTDFEKRLVSSMRSKSRSSTFWIVFVWITFLLVASMALVRPFTEHICAHYCSLSIRIVVFSKSETKVC